MYAKPCCGDRGTGKILYAKTGAVSEYTDRKRWLCGVVGRFGQADGLAGKFGQTDGIAGKFGQADRFCAGRYETSKCEAPKRKTLGTGSRFGSVCGGFAGSGTGRTDSDPY